MSKFDNELNDEEIDDLLEDYDRFEGCFMKDTLKDELPLKDNCYYIVNLQSSTDGNGSHWCCLYVLNQRIGVWFDPMGEGSPKEIEELFDTVVYDDRDLQDYHATTCGYFCMGFIIYTYNAKNIFKSLKNYNKLFSHNLLRNDAILKKILGKVGNGIIL